jgi:hypothetical protein
VGKGEAEDKIVDSRKAFTDMMRMIDPHQEMLLEVVDVKKDEVKNDRSPV